MKKSNFNQELFDVVVENCKNQIQHITKQNEMSLSSKINSAQHDNVVNALKETYQMNVKAFPGVDVLDDFVVQMNNVWTEGEHGLDQEHMQFLWYKCGEKFLKSFVQHFVDVQHFINENKK